MSDGLSSIGVDHDFRGYQPGPKAREVFRALFHLSDSELVAGRNNKHLDFRLSVLKELGGSSATVVVSTVCDVHNRFGKVYLFFIVPFHRWGVRKLLSNAMVAERL